MRQDRAFARQHGGVLAKKMCEFQEVRTMSENNGNSRSASEEPIYNIGVVARMTGIPVATLRVWERRYEFPEAGRTAGGHRLYSESEVSRLRNALQRRNRELQEARDSAARAG